MVEQSIAGFMDLFAARSDVYAEGYQKPDKPGKYGYRPVHEPLTEEVIRAHLRGERHIGVYPLVDGQVKWFAIDFDAPKDERGDPIPDAFSVAYAEADAQAQALERAGLMVYIERSQSGQGCHLWGFLTEWTDAATVLVALAAHKLDAVSFDRIFPVQPEALKGKALGNLIALPYSGKAGQQQNSKFLNRDDLTTLTPMEFLSVVDRNLPAAVTTIAGSSAKLLRKRAVASADDATPESVFATAASMKDGEFEGRPARPISGVLKLISAYGCRFMHHAWVNRRSLSEPEWYAAIQQLTCFQHGRAAAHALSKDYKGYSPREVDEKFDHAMQSPPVGTAYLREHFPKHACNGCCEKAPYYTAMKSILELVQEGSAPMRRANFNGAVDRVRKRNAGVEKAGIRYGIPTLDAVTSLRNSELTVFGAMPSMGKTAFMIDAAAKIAASGIPALVFSAETAEGGLFERFLAHEAHIDSKALRGERFAPGTTDIDPLTDAEWARLDAARDRLNGLPLYVNFTDINADQVLGNIERVLLENGIGFDDPYVVFFDYLQFGAKLGGESNYERVSRLSTEFKNIAKITNHPIVIFSQLVRDAEAMEAPSLTMFKESGRIEQDADVAMILSGERLQGRKAPRRITIVKQREGESQVALDFVLSQDICHFDPRTVAGSANRSAPVPDLLETQRPDLFG